MDYKHSASSGVKLTTHQQGTLSKLEDRQYGAIKQQDVTRLLNKVLPADDEDLKKKAVEGAMLYERSVGKDPIGYLKDKLRGAIKKAFVATSTLVNAPPQNDVMEKFTKTQELTKPRDIGDMMAAKQQGTRSDMSRIIETAIGANNAVKKAPGGDIPTKMLYYSVPELEMIDNASKMVGLGWTDADSKYLNDILTNSSGDDDSFKQRLQWIGKLIANPSHWWEAVNGMGKEAVKQSSVYKWLVQTFGAVADKFNNPNAKAIKNQMTYTGKNSGEMLSIGDAPPAAKPDVGIPGVSDGSKFGNIRPVVQASGWDAKKTEAWHSLVDAMLGDSPGAESAKTSLYVDKYFQSQFDEIYKKHHNGTSWFQADPSKIYDDMSPYEKGQFINDVRDEVSDVFKRKELPPPKFDMRGEAAGQSDPAAGELINSKTEKLLRDLVAEAEASDDFYVNQYYKHGRKFDIETRDPSILRSALLPAIQKIRNMLNDPNARLGKAEMDDIRNLVYNVPKDLAGHVNSISKQLLGYGGVPSSNDPIPDDGDSEPSPGSPEKDKWTKDTKDDKTKNKWAKEPRPPTEEDEFSGIEKKVAELRPKYGFMGQEELENTLIGTDTERQETDYTWSVFDLKPVNYYNGDNIQDNKCFGRVVDQYNYRYGRTFPMPDPPQHDPEPLLVRKAVRDIYDISQRLVDAYDNRQFRDIDPEARIPPEWDGREKAGRMVEIAPYPSQTGGSYKYPQFREPIKSLKNRGRHF